MSESDRTNDLTFLALGNEMMQQENWVKRPMLFTHLRNLSVPPKVSNPKQNVNRIKMFPSFLCSSPLCALLTDTDQSES